jgi:hypothetical protein
MWNNPRPAPEYRMGWSNRRKAAKSLRRILAWDFQRIVLAHGDLIDRNAREVAAAAWAGVLERYSHADVANRRAASESTKFLFEFESPNS